MQAKDDELKRSKVRSARAARLFFFSHNQSSY